MSIGDPSVSAPEPQPEGPSSPPAPEVAAVVRVESPHVVRYTLFVRRPGEADFSKAGAGTHPGGRHALGDLPPQTEVAGAFNIAGTPNTAYRIRFGCEVDGISAPGAEATIAGTTDAQGADARREIVRLP